MDLRPAVDQWQLVWNTPDTLSLLDEDDWRSLQLYLDTVNPFVEAVKLFSGEKYPTAPSVIPFLDEVRPP